MTANIQLYVSCHKPNTRFPASALVQPIQVGAASAIRRFDDTLHDDEGDQISDKNPSYCELTSQYWAWKNAHADYFGFMHYRRYFNFSKTEYPIHHEPFIFGDVVFDRNDDETLRRIGFDEATMRAVIESHDFVAPTSIATPDGVSVYEQYRMSAGHHIEDFDCVLDLIERHYPDVWPSAQRYIAQDRLYVCNMFVMRADLFDRYSSFLFDILGRHERLCDHDHYTAVGRRVAGYLGERLCGIYLTYLYDCGYNGIDLQRVYFRDTSAKAAAALPGGAGNQTQGTAGSGAKAELGVKFVGATRGGFKIYVPLQAEGCAEGTVRLKSASRAADGTTLPSKIVRHNGRDVLVLPVLDVDQDVTVEALDARGSLVSSVSRVFAAKKTARESKMNTLLRNRTVLDERNCDNEVLPGDVRVHVDRVIADVDGTDIVHGRVCIPVQTPDAKTAYCEVVALDARGAAVNQGDWVCLGDETERDKSCPGHASRVVTYSVRIPRIAPFTIWARITGCALQDGFACIEPRYAADLRRDWAGMATPACDQQGYDAWFRESHRATPADLELQRHRTFADGPLFSIVVPLYKTPLDFLRDAVESVRAQTYSRWELILVNSTPQEAGLAQAVAQYCKADPRIKAVTLERNLGITENTNEGIKVATGDFLCFFDHDDVLEPDVLFWYADALERNPQIDMLYCDEDKLVDGRYANPYFKPDWDPELLLAMNYVCHFLTVRKAIVDGLDLPAREYDGSQDYHMTFRVGEKSRAVCHIPRVLYHWRVHENSTAKAASQKDYALETSRLAVETHLERCGIKGKVADSKISPRRFVVDYDLGAHPLVSIVIPNKDAVQVLSRCLVSIRRHTSYDNYEIVIVENNSVQPETFDYYREIEKTDPRVRVIKLMGMESFNFSRIINFGVENAKGDYLLFLNNDTEVLTPDWIERLLGPCMQPGVGVTGAKLLFPDRTVQHAGVICGFVGPCHEYYQLPERAGGNFEAALVSHDALAVTGACMLTSREMFDRVGGMREELSVNYNDVDYCLKVLAEGERVVFVPNAELLHYESVSRGSETSGDKALRFRTEKGKMMELWPEIYEGTSPYGNPNLASGDPYEKIDMSLPRGIWR